MRTEWHFENLMKKVDSSWKAAAKRERPMGLGIMRRWQLKASKRLKDACKQEEGKCGINSRRHVSDIDSLDE